MQMDNSNTAVYARKIIVQYSAYCPCCTLLDLPNTRTGDYIYSLNITYMLHTLLNIDAMQSLQR
jgi:hypothetical protein